MHKTERIYFLELKIRYRTRNQPGGLRFSIITCIIHWSWIWREGFPEGVIQLRHPIFLRYYCRVVPIYFTFQEPSSKPNSQPITHGSGVLASFKHIHKNLRCSSTWTWKFFLQSESNKSFAKNDLKPLRFVQCKKLLNLLMSCCTLSNQPNSL